MEWLSRLRLTSIPEWSKYLFLFAIVIIGVINSFVFLDGAINDKDTLIESSLHILGVLLPIMSITYVALYIKYGEDAIIQHTKKLFMGDLPRSLGQLQESDLAFRDVESLDTMTGSALRPITVESNYQDGRIESDFKIGMWDADVHSYLMIRLEINYRRINFNLYLSKDQVNAICNKNKTDIELLNTDENAKIILEALGHSLKGATYSERAMTKKAEDDSSSDAQTAYVFNGKLIVRELLGEKYLCVVAMKAVSSGFIWDSGERFYFCFDLMLMLRAMIDECPKIRTIDECLLTSAQPRARRVSRVDGETMFELGTLSMGIVGIAIVVLFGNLMPFHLNIPRQISSLSLELSGVTLIILAFACEIGLKITYILQERRRRRPFRSIERRTRGAVLVRGELSYFECHDRQASEMTCRGVGKQTAQIWGCR